MLPQCSLVGLEMVYNALPKLGEGYRLKEVRALLDVSCLSRQPLGLEGVRGVTVLCDR